MKKVPLLLLLVPACTFADVVYLKGGVGTLTGRIVEQSETMVKVDVGDGIIGVPPYAVDRIVRGHSTLDEYDERAAKLGAQDVKGWRSLGKWALDQGLSKQSSEAYAKVIAVAPDDAEARKYLGFVLLDGKWLTEEESYRARGFVKYDGEWMTPAEAQVAQSDRAAEQARREAETRAIEAEIATAEAEQRAEEAEERAREAEEEAERASSYPVYWGNFGYGLTYWPSGTSVTYR